MDRKEYKCDCGKLFTNKQSFNGHKSHCKTHWLLKYGNLDSFFERNKKATVQARKAAQEFHTQQAKQHQVEAQRQWANDKHYCERCGKLLPLNLEEVYGSGRFCSKECSHAREQTIEIRQKKSQTASQRTHKNKHNQERKVQAQQAYWASPKKCCICGKVLPYERRHRTLCGSVECQHEKLVQAGRQGAAARVKRSKNEILFYQLCLQHFQTVEHNVPQFNGWDADIIIEDIHYAILWNGPWHYRQILTNQSLSQIQNRDRLKVEAIKACGYTPYIIKDESYGNNAKYVADKFQQFLQSIEKT